MAKYIKASLCFTDLLEAAKAGHSAFSRSDKNKKVYFNLTVWINDEVDKFGNNAGFQLSSSKEKQEKEGKIYVGNGKHNLGIESAQGSIQEPKKVNDALNDLKDDFPF